MYLWGFENCGMGLYSVKKKYILIELNRIYLQLQKWTEKDLIVKAILEFLTPKLFVKTICSVFFFLKVYIFMRASTLCIN